MNNLSLHIIDIIQNSVRAKATAIVLSIDEMTFKDILKITIKDNGKGMTPCELKRLEDPFFTSRTTRRVGMGIPLFKQAAEQAGGAIKIESEPGVGTKVTAFFRLSHIDLPPMGDVANAFALMTGANPDVDFIFNYGVNGNVYSLDILDVKQAVKGMGLNQSQSIRLVTEMIQNNIDTLKGENVDG